MIRSLSAQVNIIKSDITYTLNVWKSFGINTFMILINYAFGIVTASFSFDPFRSKNIFASQDSHFQIATFLLKATISPILALYSSLNFTQVVGIIILCFTLSVYRIFTLLYSLPFYHYKAAKLATDFTAITLWISFVNIILLILRNNGQASSLNAIYLILLPLPLVIKLFSSYLTKIVDSCMWRSPTACKTKREVFLKLLAYQVFSDKVSITLNSNIPPNRAEIIFMGTLSEHSETCQSSNCVCSFLIKKHNRNPSEHSMSSLRDLLSTCMYRMTYMCLEEAIGKIKENDSLKISLANLIITESPNNLRSALGYLFSATNLGLCQQIMKMTLKNKIQQSIQAFNMSNSANRINMTRFVGYHQATTDFISHLVVITNKYISFWEEYANASLKMIRVIEKSEAIEESAKVIDDLWKMYTDKYEHFSSVVNSSYRLYLALVRNAPYSSHKIGLRSASQKNINSMNITRKYISEQDVTSSQLISLYLSMSKERTGKILYASENIEKSLGYKQQDIINKNLDYLMPPHLVGKHNEYIRKHIEQSHDFLSKDYYVHEGFIKTSKGTIKPCVAHVSIFPFLKDELVYISAIKILPTKSDYIFIDNTGYISSFSSGVGSLFNLCAHDNIHISEVCLDMDKLKINFDLKASIRHLEMKKTVYLRSSDNRSFYGIESHKADKDLSDDDRRVLTEQREALVDLNFMRRGDDTLLSKYKTQIKQLDLEDKVYMLTLEPAFVQDITHKEELDVSEHLSSEADNSSLQSAIPEEEQKQKKIPISGRTRKDSTENSPRDSSFIHNLSTRNPIIHTQNLDSRLTQAHDSMLKNSQAIISPSVLMHLDESLDESTSNENINSHRKLIPARKDPKVSNIRRRSGLNKPSEKSSISSNTTSVYPKLEKAIYSIPADGYVRTLKGLGSLYIMTCITLCIVFLFQVRSDLELIRGNLSVLTTSSMRLFYITGLNRMVRALAMSLTGLVSVTRYYTIGFLDFRSYVLSLVGVVQTQLNIQNSFIRVSLDGIAENLRKRFYMDLIPVVSNDISTPDYKLNTFDLVSSISVRAKRLSGYTNTTFATKGLSDMNFILNNTMNDLLTQSEGITGIVSDDNNQKFNSIMDLSMYTIIACCLFGMFIIMVFSYQQFRLAQNRKRLIEVFCSLDRNEVEFNVRRVKLMKTELSRVHLDVKDVKNYDIYSPSGWCSTESVKTGGRVRSIPADLGGVNSKVLKMHATIFFMFLITLAPFIVMNRIIAAKNDISMREINTINTINSNLNDMAIITVSIYEYIQFNGTTKIRGNPIGEEWEAAFQRSARSQDTLARLESGQLGDKSLTDSDVTLFLSGNLCNLIHSLNKICPLFKAGTIDRGIIGVNSYILSVLRTVKDTFDKSNRSFASAKKVLGTPDLIISEYVYLLAQIPGYQLFGEIMQVRTEAYIQEGKRALMVPTIITVCLFVVVAFIASQTFLKLLEREKGKWKKLLRKIPFSIVVTNKLLKTYLVKEATNSRQFIDLKL